MGENREFERLKVEFTRYLDVVRDAGFSAEQGALGGLIALLAVRNRSLQINRIPQHEIESVIEKSVQGFIKDTLALGYDPSGSFQIRYDYPALFRFLVEAEFLRLEDDVELLQLLDEMFPISASNGASVTPECIADLMVSLIGIEQHQSVFDPSMGTGAFLRAAQDHVRGDFSYIGADKNRFNLLVVKLKAYLSGHVNYDELAGSAFAFAHSLPKFDIVVGNPPIGKMPKVEAQYRYFDVLNGIVAQEMTLNVIELGLQHLKPGGKAAFLVPMGVLFSGGSSAEIRQSWLERKLLKMVVTLPSGMLYHTSLKCAILVFENSRKSEKVRLVSAEDCSEKSRENRQVLSIEGFNAVLNRANSTIQSEHVVDVSYSEVAKHSFSLAPNEYSNAEPRINKQISEKWEKIGDIAVVVQGT